MGNGLLTAQEIADTIRTTRSKDGKWHSVYFVGGYVRDKFLKKPNHDIDIATSATYEELEKMFPGRIKVDGKSFLVAFIDGIEVATYRKDIYSNILFSNEKELVEVKPVQTIYEDLSRRDLTINSMAICPFSNEVIDPHNGMDDIKNKLIRFNGDADDRIVEDPVRMLRACRFLANNKGFRFQSDTFQAIKDNCYMIQEVKPERIRLEILKALDNTNNYSGNFFRALNNTGLLQYIFPIMDVTVGQWGGIHHNETVFEHCCMACDNIISGNPLLKLAAFLHDIGKPLAWNLYSNGSFKKHDKFGIELAEKELKKLRFGSNEIKFICFMIENHMDNITINSTPKSIRKFVAKMGNEDNISSMIDLMVADHDANMKTTKKHGIQYFNDVLEHIGETTKENKVFSLKDLAIDGKDVMKVLEIGPCKKVGQVLKELFGYVLERPELNNKISLTVLLEDIKKQDIDKE